MKPLIRDICSLADRKYDLLVVGGGIFGICAAWDAALRGLSVALIEKKDFSHATSANHLKMVHGGIRYLQHFDIPRIRESSFERSALLRIAPHMVQPLPIVIPTYGYGLKGKWFLGSGMIIYDILTMDRNRALAPERSIPWGKYISRDSVLKLFPGIKKEGLTGAAVFCDGQMYNPPRLAISFLRSAVNKGAVAANYVEAVGFKREKNLINGIEAVDKITGRHFEIHAKCVLNAAGPWSHRFLAKSLGIQIDPPPTFSRDLAFVINRQSTNHHAIAVSTSAQDADSMIDRGGRHLFIAPWRNYTLIGVWHSIFRDSPENITVRKSELEQFVDEVNIAFPGIDLSINEILTVNTGLTLYGSEAKQGTDKMSFGKRSILIDHAKDHNIEGIITLIGVRATTARGTAQKAINLVMNKLNMPEKDSATDSTPIMGGNIGSFNSFLDDAVKSNRTSLSEKLIKSLVHNYGSQFNSILDYAKENPAWIEPIGQSNTIKAEIVHAIREEMAIKFEDIVMRRTDLATGEIPDSYTLRSGLRVMADELGWDKYREDQELKSTLQSINRTIL